MRVCVCMYGRVMCSYAHVFVRLCGCVYVGACVCARACVPPGEDTLLRTSNSRGRRGMAMTQAGRHLRQSVIALLLATACAFAPAPNAQTCVRGGAVQRLPLLRRQQRGTGGEPPVPRQQPGAAAMHCRLAGDDAAQRLPSSLLPSAVLAWAWLPLAAVADAGGEDKRVLYTAIYTVAHLPVIVPFLLFWKVDAQTKIKGAAVATPFFVAWIALLGGWLRY